MTESQPIWSQLCNQGVGLEQLIPALHRERDRVLIELAREPKLTTETILKFALAWDMLVVKLPRPISEEENLKLTPLQQWDGFHLTERKIYWVLSIVWKYDIIPLILDGIGDWGYAGPEELIGRFEVIDRDIAKALSESIAMLNTELHGGNHGH